MRPHTVLLDRTAPAQLLLYSTCETFALAARVVASVPTSCFGSVWRERPPARRATRWAKRSLEVGTAKAAAARRTWQRSVAANMTTCEGGD